MAWYLTSCLNCRGIPNYDYQKGKITFIRTSRQPASDGVSVIGVKYEWNNMFICCLEINTTVTPSARLAWNKINVFYFISLLLRHRILPYAMPPFYLFYSEMRRRLIIFVQWLVSGCTVVCIIWVVYVLHWCII